MKLVIATQNSGKAKEIKQILSSFEVLTLKDLQYTEEIEENGSSFSENAFIKADVIYRHFHGAMPDAFFLADDSGLSVDALSGRPGIYSARYAGENSTSVMLIRKVLAELKDVPYEKRTARFTCAMVLIDPNAKIKQSQGNCEGLIGFEPKGDNGFGYDPIFLPEDFQYRKTMSELTDDEKNSISHRRRALDGIRKLLNQNEE